MPVNGIVTAPAFIRPISRTSGVGAGVGARRADPATTPFT